MLEIITRVVGGHSLVVVGGVITLVLRHLSRNSRRAWALRSSLSAHEFFRSIMSSPDRKTPGRKTNVFRTGGIKDDQYNPDNGANPLCQSGTRQKPENVRQGCLKPLRSKKLGLASSCTLWRNVLDMFNRRDPGESPPSVSSRFMNPGEGPACYFLQLACSYCCVLRNSSSISARFRVRLIGSQDE